MSFAENLKQVRKEKGLSQEDLAEIMDVSRQAVSKWELGESYPETEKLLLLAHQLDLSLDRLMGTGKDVPSRTSPAGAASILIVSPHENVVVSCCKVASSQEMKGRKSAPRYALFGVSPGGNSFWGEPTSFLGWYADEQSLSREIGQIQQAILQGLSSYELQYSVKTQRKGLLLYMQEETNRSKEVLP